MGAQSERIAAALRKQATSVVRMLALELDAELRKLTPVDTGHARRNWIPSVGQPHAGEVQGDGEHAAGVAEVLAYELAKGSLWVSNAVPYIRRLNYGSSDQAPAGFVERAIDVAMSKVQQKGGDVSAMRQQFRDEAGSAMAGNLASAYSPLGD